MSTLKHLYAIRDFLEAQRFGDDEAKKTLAYLIDRIQIEQGESKIKKGWKFSDWLKGEGFEWNKEGQCFELQDVSVHVKEVLQGFFIMCISQVNFNHPSVDSFPLPRNETEARFLFNMLGISCKTNPSQNSSSYA